MMAAVVAAVLPSPVGREEAAVGVHLSGCPALPGRAAGEQQAEPWKCCRSCSREGAVGGGLEQDKKQAQKHCLHQRLFAGGKRLPAPHSPL